MKGIELSTSGDHVTRNLCNVDNFCDSPGIPGSGSCKDTSTNDSEPDVMSPASRLRNYANAVEDLGGASYQRRRSIYGLLVQVGCGSTPLAEAFKDSLGQQYDMTLSKSAQRQLKLTASTAIEREIVEEKAKEVGLDYITYQRIQLYGFLNSVGRNGEAPKELIDSIIDVMNTIPVKGNGFLPYFELLQRQYKQGKTDIKMSKFIISKVTEAYGLEEALEVSCKPGVLAQDAAVAEQLWNKENEIKVIEWLTGIDENVSAVELPSMVGTLSETLGSDGSYLPFDGLSASGSTNNNGLPPKNADTAHSDKVKEEKREYVKQPETPMTNEANVAGVRQIKLLKTESFCFENGREVGLTPKPPFVPNLRDPLIYGGTDNNWVVRSAQSASGLRR